MNKAIIEKVNGLKGVVGVTHTDLYGELLSSTIDDESLNEFIAFLPGITPVIEEGLAMGEIKQIVLKGSGEDNLMVFMESDGSLSVQTELRSSLQILTRQVKEIL
jgi:predicted regulator of Ras-like GTPase activity (Roadblock/LC7/MglB family)